MLFSISHQKNEYTCDPKISLRWTCSCKTIIAQLFSRLSLSKPYRYHLVTDVWLYALIFGLLYLSGCLTTVFFLFWTVLEEFNFPILLKNVIHWGLQASSVMEGRISLWWWLVRDIQAVYFVRLFFWVLGMATIQHACQYIRVED